ncbi:MAG: phosphatase PAP2 family protein [Ignavibacteriaceae bacterium]
MTKKSSSRFILINFIILFLIIIGQVNPVYPQSSENDSSYHPYHVNYWITGSIIAGGLVLEKIGVPWISNKSSISIAELQNLDSHDITPIDRWALNFDPSNMNYFVKISDQFQSVVVFLPVLTMLDHNIRRDWIDILMMYLEAQIITNNMYLYSPIGATFQNRLRPVVYYDALGDSEVRTRGANRNSMYSGHVAATAAASFFTAKIYCDYHPELGWKKFLVYGAASVPPLVMSYFRLRALAHFPTDIMVGFGVGALCGILIPEFHRISTEKVTLGVYSSMIGTGISMQWQPDFLR